MEGTYYKRRLNNKRPNESENLDRPRKRVTDIVIYGDGVEKIYNVQVLLPNGTSLGLKFRERDNDMPIEQFTDVVKEEYFRVVRQTGSQKMKRKINWKSKDLHFVDKYENEIKKRVNFEKFKSNNSYIRLHDGSGEAELYENMWDLTPDTELLMELPEEYTFETALADLIDNSLQAVWSNDVNERRLISVDSIEDRISIFDTGPGMDNTDENSIVKWGKIGASVHRSSRGQAIGGNPPYLMPAFGMFGYGGPIASMHLGRHALVSSKSKESEKVYILRLEREALLTNSGSEKTWKTDGGVRNPFDDEIQKSPHGTFTMVEIFEPKMKSLDILQLQCKLKDIYFPYIQCDEMSSTGKTITPIEFQVNGIDLAELNGGEVAITNLHSCNGPEFVIQLHFNFNKDNVATNSPGLRASLEANAKLKCVYFPIVEGKESIDRILEKLKAEGCEINETFESFSRVSIRRLGRLLPDARWTWLPFMEPRQKKGDRVQILKRCCLRVKCFIETDGGFKPTPSKTDLAHHHPFTTALKNLGSKPSEGEREVNLQIYRDSKPLTLSQLERQYQEWIYQMHDRYDEEVDCGEDQPLHIISPSNKKGLGISSDVVRVHKVIWRKGTSWKSGQKIKVLKGACAGCHKNNIYATLECFLLEGFQGDAGGEARLICRALGLADENGCKVAVNDGNTCIDIRGSLSLPISVIDSGKCLAIESAEWEYQIEKQRLKTPSTIEILSAKYCQELEIEGALPFDNTVYAGHVTPKEIVAIVRPASFNSTSVSKKLDQKYIVRQNVEMAIEIKFRAEGKDTQVQHIYSGRVAPSSRKGFHGLYVFSLGCKCPKIFQKAGIYTFSFSLRELSIRTSERNVKVKALSEVERWGLLSDEQSPQYSVSVGSCFPPISIACYDKYGNHIAFTSVPELIVKINSTSGVLALVHKMKVDISRSMLILKRISIESNELDNIRPCYRANLVISPRDESFSISIPCEVTPGSLHRITVNTQNLEKQLLPGSVIQEFILEMFDAYGNHVKGGAQVLFKLDGFQFQDQIGFARKVDDLGCIDLSGLLKVSGGYGTKVSISVLSSDKEVFRKEFQTEKRELIASSRVPKSCAVGSQLENIVFEVINSEGDVDETIHDEEKYGQSHTLTIKAESLNTDDYVRYSFRRGRCVVRAIPLPRKEGIFCFEAAHSRYPDLHLTIEVHVEQAQKVELESVQPHFSDGKVLLLPDPSTLKVPKVEYDDAHNQCSDGNILLLRNSSASEDVGYLLGSIINDQKEIEDELLKSGLNVGHHEETLKMLNDQLVAIKNDISMLQDSMDLDLVNHTDYFPDKEVMMKRIESKTDSAAAVICSLFGRSPSQEQHNQFTECILGVVALLGTVNSNGLSRILAEYLGEDQMLAVVCKSYAAADDLEKYEQNGIVNRGHALHGAAAELGKSIDGRYLVICLEEIRPYTGELGSDSQKKLAIPDPTLPTGKSPPGYLGYAVNMINLDVHLHTKTAAGHGLRQTLFYHLFGELQVYETRENMKMATACIKHAAVSLDGGIMRGIGVISLGYGEPYIHFPVIASRSQMHSNPQSVEILKQIEEKEGDLRKTLSEIERVTRIHRKFVKRFKKKRDRYKKFLDEKGPLLGSWGLQV